METRKHSKTIGGSFKNMMCEKKEKIEQMSMLGWIWRSFYSQVELLLASQGVRECFFRRRNYDQKKVMRASE